MLVLESSVKRAVTPLPLAGRVAALVRARRVGDISRQTAPVESPPPQPSLASGRGGPSPLLRHRVRAPAWLICLLLAMVASPAHAQSRLDVVASFSILSDFVRNVGGDRVNVTALVGPDGDVHVYTPAPADAKKIADAKLVIINGLGLEGWLSRLVQSSGGKAAIVTATQGIAPRKLGSDADPHAWQSVVNARIYVGNIRNALIAADAAGATAYRANADAYLIKLDALDREV